MDEERKDFRVPMAQDSPRIDPKTKALKWYYKDTFEIEWKISLWDNDAGSAVHYGPEDQILFSFYTYDGTRKIYDFSCTIEKEDKKGWINSEDDTVVLSFDKEVSRFFRPGKYTYKIKYIRGDDPLSQDITTIKTGGIAEVENGIR